MVGGCLSAGCGREKPVKVWSDLYDKAGYKQLILHKKIEICFVRSFWA